MDRILIIQTAFLGDVILATPVVSELKRIYPQASIDFLVKKGNEQLLMNDPALTEVHVFDKKKGKFGEIKRLLRQFRKNRYDLVINLHRFGSSGIIAGLSKGKKIIGFRKNPFSFLYTKKFEHQIGDGTHEVERNLSLIQEFGSVSKKRPTLFPSQADEDAIKAYKTDTYYCLAPASVWFTKQLPKQKWKELIQLLDKNASIYLLGGPDDTALCDEIKSEVSTDNVFNLAGKLTLLQSAALMKNANRNFVNDSGPLHIASAMNAPVTAFFCSTIPEFGFGPLSEDSRILAVDGLECRPCGLHGHAECPKGHFKCGKEIDVSAS